MKLRTGHLVFGLSFALLAPGLYWGLPSQLPTELDAIAPYSALSFFLRYSEPNVASVYPAAQQLIALVATLFVVVYEFLTGNLTTLSTSWPYGLREPALFFSHVLLAARVVTALMGAAIIVVLVKLSNRPPLTALLPGLVLLFSGVFTYYARTANTDVPYLFWFSLAFLAACRSLNEQARPVFRLAAVGMFGAMAVATKSQAAFLVWGLFLAVLANARGTRLRTTGIVTFSSAVTYLLVAVLPHPARWWHHVTNYTYSNAAIGSPSAATSSLLPSLIHAASIWLLLAFGVAAAILVLRRRRQELLLIALPLLTYGVFIGLAGVAFERFMMPIAFLMCATVVFANNGVNPSRAPLVASIVACLAIYQCVTGWLPVTHIQVFDMKSRLADELPMYLKEGATIEWVGGTTSFPRLETYTAYKFVWSRDREVPGESIRRVISTPWQTPDAILAEEPLPNRKLIYAWTFPLYLASQNYLPIVKEYYLYEFGEGVSGR